MIEWTVVDEQGVPVAGVPVQVYNATTNKLVDQGKTGRSGQVTFILDEPGIYHVHTHANPSEAPSINRVAVNSTVQGVVVRGGAGNGGSFQRTIEGAVEAVQDFAAYPVLTEEIGYPPSPLARSSGMTAPGQAGSVGQIATKAISDVLGWQVKNDQRAFVGALTASFPISTDEGRTVATWKPRSYALQTDLSGGITGAQASIYARAKDALDQSLPLLDGLYSLNPEAKDNDITAIRTTVRTQFTDLVTEMGQVGGPRVSRITSLFLLLLGQLLPSDGTPPQGGLQTDPDQIQGSLGTLRRLFGLGSSTDLVNTVVDEQNATNFRIIADYVSSVAQSWINNVLFFLVGPKAKTPFFGTQLVLLSRQLSVVAETVNELRFTLDSVFIGPAERQTLRIQFASPDDPDMFLEDLLTWIDQFASEEGPRLIQDGGKFAVGESFVPIATQLHHLASDARHPANPPGEIPPGYRTPRVRNAFRDLDAQLQQLVDLSLPIKHAITPEPPSESLPGLKVVSVTPSTLDLRRDRSILVFGTGFRGDAVPTSITLASIAQGTATIASKDVQVLSDNVIYATLEDDVIAVLKSGPYTVRVTQGGDTAIGPVLTIV